MNGSSGSGISQRGEQIPKGPPSYYLNNFPQKLHENEEFWPGGGVLPLDSPLKESKRVCKFINYQNIFENELEFYKKFCLLLVDRHFILKGLPRPSESESENILRSFAANSLIFTDCSLIFFAFAFSFAWSG